jgi:hypothetical protein
MASDRKYATIRPVKSGAADRKKDSRQAAVAEKGTATNEGSGGSAPTPSTWLTKMSLLSVEEDELKQLAAFGRGMFGKNGRPVPLTVSVCTKLVVTNTTHLPQFRVSSNPAQGLLTGKGDTGVPALWAYAQLIWNCFYVKRLRVEVISNPSTMASAVGDLYIGLLYEGAAADTQSTTLATAFAAGTSSRNKKYWRAGAGSTTQQRNGFFLDWKNPFPLKSDSSGWQLTPTTSEIGVIQFTTNIATTADSDCYGYALCTWECMLKEQSTVS